MPASKCAKPAPPETVLSALRDSWILSLQARNLSPTTIKIYRKATDELLRHLATTGGPSAPEELARAHVEGLLADMIARGMSPSTVSLTYRALQQWTKWLVEEEEIDVDPMAKMSTPIVPDVPVPVIPDGDLKQLVAACAGKDFAARRDTALIRVFLDTGARLSEIAGLGVPPTAICYTLKPPRRGTPTRIDSPMPATYSDNH